MKFLIVIDLIIIFLSIIAYISSSQTLIDNFIYNHLLFNDTLTLFFKIVTNFGDFIILFIFFIISIYILNNKKKSHEMKILCISSLLGIILVQVLKYIFKRNRPNINQMIDISGFPFPSGHSLMSMVIYGYIIVIIYNNIKNTKKWILIAILSFLILLIGISRIYLGVHYATDVIFGYSVGILVIFLTHKVLTKK